MPAPSTLLQFRHMAQAMYDDFAPIAHVFDSRLLTELMAFHYHDVANGRLHASLVALSKIYFDCTGHHGGKQAARLARLDSPRNHPLDPFANLRKANGNDTPRTPREGLSAADVISAFTSARDILFPGQSNEAFKDTVLEAAGTYLEDETTVRSWAVGKYYSMPSLCKLRILIIILGYLTAMDFSGAKEIDPLDMCMLFARNDSAPARILDGMGMAQTRWGPAFRNYLFETMETICAGTGEDVSDYQASIHGATKRSLTNRQWTLLALTYMQVALNATPCPMWIKFTRGTFNIDSGALVGTGATFPNGVWHVTDAEVEQIAIVRAGNPGFTRRQELDAINAWAHEQDPPLRPLNCFRSYSAYYWILISRKDVIDARVAELQDA